MEISKDLRNLYITLISLAISIILYFIIMKRKFKNKISHNDPLNKKVLNLPIFGKNCCSWWPISHFVAFLIFAYIWPQYWYHLFGLGVLWEVVEWIFKKCSTPKGEVLKFKRTRVGNGQVEYEQWWSSSSKDVIFNSAGILCGLLLAKYKPQINNFLSKI